MKKIILSVLLFLPLMIQSGCSDKCSTKDRYLVVTTYAGMANRLRLLASAQIMADLTGRKLLVNWPILENEMPGQWADFFRNPLVNFEESALARQGCKLADIKESESSPYVKNLGNQNSAQAYKTLNFIPQITEPIVYFESSLSFVPDEQFMTRKDYDSKRNQWFKNLEPVKSIVDGVSKFKLDNKFEDYFMVGIHYRGWQLGAPDVRDAGTPDQTNKYVPEFIAKMKDALARPRSDTENKMVAFYLSTDNVDAKNTILAVPEFAGRVFARSEKADRSSIAGQQSDLVDFFLLGTTNYIVGTYQSSFSDEASHLTKEDRKENIGARIYK